MSTAHQRRRRTGSPSVLETCGAKDASPPQGAAAWNATTTQRSNHHPTNAARDSCSQLSFSKQDHFHRRAAEYKDVDDDDDPDARLPSVRPVQSPLLPLQQQQQRQRPHSSRPILSQNYIQQHPQNQCERIIIHQPRRRRPHPPNNPRSSAPQRIPIPTSASLAPQRQTNKPHKPPQSSAPRRSPQWNDDDSSSSSSSSSGSSYQKNPTQPPPPPKYQPGTAPTSSQPAAAAAAAVVSKPTKPNHTVLLAVDDSSPDNDDDDDDELEIPYAHAYDDTQRRVSSELCAIPKEPLRPGDVIAYYHPAFVAGTSDAYRLTQVVATTGWNTSNTSKAKNGIHKNNNNNNSNNHDVEFPLLLDNNELLPLDCTIQRVQEYRRGRLYRHEGIPRSIRHFMMETKQLPAGERLHMAGSYDGIVAKMKQIFHHTKHDLETKGIDMDNGELDNNNNNGAGTESDDESDADKAPNKQSQNVRSASAAAPDRAALAPTSTNKDGTDKINRRRIESASSSSSSSSSSTQTCDKLPCAKSHTPRATTGAGITPVNPLLQQRHKHSSLSESQNSTASSSQLSFKYSKERTGALSVRSTASVSNRIGTRLSTAKSSDSSQSDASAFAAGVKPPASPRQPLALRKDRTATHSENLTHRRTSHQWHDLTQDDEDEDDLDDMNDKIRRKNVTRPSVSESKTMQSNPNTSLLSLKKHNMASNKQSPKKSTRGECRISSNLSSRPTMDRSIRLSVEDPLHFVVTADRRDPAAAYNGLTDTSDDDDTFLSDMRPLGGSKHASTTVPANNGRVGSFLDKSSPESDAKRRRKVAEECQKAAQVEEYQSVISNFRSKNEKTKSRKRKAPHVLSTTQQKPSSDSVLSQTTCSESRSGRSISKCAQQPPARLLSQGFESSLGRFHARSRLAEPVREDISNNSSDDESFFRKQKKLKRLSRNITAGTSSNRGKEDTDSITTTFTSSQNASGSRAFHSRGKERGNSMKSSTVLSHARRPLQAVALSTTSWGSTTTGMMRDD